MEKADLPWNLVLMFDRITILKFLSGLHCVVIWTHPRLPPLHPNTVHRGPTQEALGPALRSTKPGDTAVKLNLRASLSPGCQGRTSGMSPGDKGRLVSWFLHMLTFVRIRMLSENSSHRGQLGYHRETQMSSLKHQTQRLFLKHGLLP